MLSCCGAVVGLSLLLLLGSCRSPGPAAPTPAPAPPLSSYFSGAQAFADLEALAALGPRTSGTPAAQQARVELERRLKAAGLSVEEIPLALSQSKGASPAPAVALRASIPGSSSTDVLLLEAPYTGSWQKTSPPGSCAAATNGASGAALLVELGRVLKAHPLPYTVWLVFMDEGPPGSSPHVVPAGSEALAAKLAAAGDLDRIRVAVFLDRLAEPHLVVARDLLSQRTYRERFFRAAAHLGEGKVFPAGADFESAPSGAIAFFQADMRRVVALVDSSFANGTAPEGRGTKASTSSGPKASAEPAKSPTAGSLAGAASSKTEASPVSACSQASLTAAGRVTLAGLADISALLQRVDRFAGPAVAPSGQEGSASSSAPPR